MVFPKNYIVTSSRHNHYFGSCMIGNCRKCATICSCRANITGTYREQWTCARDSPNFHRFRPLFIWNTVIVGPIFFSCQANAKRISNLTSIRGSLSNNVDKSFVRKWSTCRKVTLFIITILGLG